MTAAFDPLAADYDTTFTRSALGRTLRAHAQARLAATFAAGQRVLELGCGTGEDALWLAERGVRVVALDASPGMIEVARTKQRARGAALPVEFLHRPMEALDRLRAAAPFDGVYSNFGAVNCIDDLAALARTLAGLLPPGAPLVWVVMGRHVPWEWAWYLHRGEPRKAFRRYRDPVAWRGLYIRYPTPGRIARLLAPHFEVRRRAPLGWALPPSYAADWLERAPRRLAALTWLETAGQSCAPLAALADHYIVEARRAPTDPAPVPRN